MTANSPSPQAVSLRECPFCGGPAKLMAMTKRAEKLGYQYVECRSCGCDTGSIAAWNRRASPADGVVVPRAAIWRLILAADSYGVQHLDSDDMDETAQELQDATEGMKDLVPHAASPALAATSGGVTADSLTETVSDETMRELLSCKDVGSVRARLAQIIKAHLSSAQPAPAGGGEAVAWRVRPGPWASSLLLKCPEDQNVSGFMRNTSLALGEKWSVQWWNGAWGICIRPATPPSADADKLREALTDLVSWFTTPVQGQYGMVWVIPAGERGADDAVAEALARLSTTEATATPADAVEGEGS